MVRVWRWLYSSHNTLHSRSCKRSALQLLLAASSAQQDKATVILHSPHPPSIVSTLVTLFSSYSPRTPLSSPFSSFRISHSSPPISSYTWRSSLWSLDPRRNFGRRRRYYSYLSRYCHGHEEICIKFCMLIYLIFRKALKREQKRYEEDTL